MNILTFPFTYVPDVRHNRMRNVGEVARARAYFLEKRPPNLTQLLASRYEWMNPYLVEKGRIFEIGSGSGLSREFIKNPCLQLTDVTKNEWIDEVVDASALPFDNDSVDALLLCHALHHLAYPARFFRQAYRTLKPGGVLLICDLNLSFFLKCLLVFMRHEGWSQQVDVLSERHPVNDPSDPWAANCAIPTLLFENPARFHSSFPGLFIERHERTEGFLFPLSGGVVAKTLSLPLPRPALKAIERIDERLSRWFPNAFPLGMRVAIRKIG